MWSKSIKKLHFVKYNVHVFFTPSFMFIPLLIIMPKLVWSKNIIHNWGGGMVLDPCRLNPSKQIKGSLMYLTRKLLNAICVN